MNFTKIFNNNLNQNYLLFGDVYSLMSDIKQFFNNFENQNDLFIFSGKEIKIDDVRRIKELAYKTKSQNEHPKIFLLSYFFWPIISQNALLKVLEEPGSETVFVMIAPHKREILDTVLSRCGTYNIQDSDKKIIFMNKNFLERKEYIGQLSDEDIINFLSQLEWELLKNKKYLDQKYFDDFYTIKKTLIHRGIGYKYALEFFAFYFPILNNHV